MSRWNYDRTDRRGDLQYQGLLIGRWDRVPVFHAWGDIRKAADGRLYDTTMCGVEAPAAVPVLPVAHLDKFARPCRKCWADDESVAS